MSSTAPITANVNAHVHANNARPDNPINVKNVETIYIVNDSSIDTTDCAKVGPLIGSGAPYSAIGIFELAVFISELLPCWNGQLDPMTASLSNYAFWQY